MQATAPRQLLRIAGLTFTAGNSAVLGYLVLYVVLTAAGLFLLNFSLPKALILALAAVLLHLVSEIAHQLGHAWAARSTGYPMIGVHLWGVLSSSKYPLDEPSLPKSVHTRRALGGPILSLIITIAALVPFFLLRSGSGPWWLALFFFLDNLLVFSVGAFLPLGFTDGSTLLHLARDNE